MIRGPRKQTLEEKVKVRMSVYVSVRERGRQTDMGRERKKERERERLERYMKAQVARGKGDVSCPSFTFFKTGLLQGLLILTFYATKFLHRIILCAAYKLLFPTGKLFLLI